MSVPDWLTGLTVLPHTDLPDNVEFLLQEHSGAQVIVFRDGTIMRVPTFAEMFKDFTLETKMSVDEQRSNDDLICYNVQASLRRKQVDETRKR